MAQIYVQLASEAWNDSRVHLGGISLGKSKNIIIGIVGVVGVGVNVNVSVVL